MAGLDSAIGDLFVKIKPDTKGFGKDVANSTASSTNRALGGVQKASRVALGAVVAVGAGLIAVGKEADEAYDNIRQGTGATGDALKGLKDDFDSVLNSVPATAADAGTAIANLNTAFGATGDGLQLLSENFLNLSRITGTDLETNIASVSEAFNQFGITMEETTPKEMEGVMDNLFRVYQNTGVSVDELSNQLARNGAQFRAVGLDINDGAALIGSLGKAGIEATQVVPGLTRVLKDAADQGISGAEAFEQIQAGIVGATTESEAMNLAFEAFGTRGGAVLGEAIRDGKLDLEDLRSLYNDFDGDSIAKVAKDTMSFGEQVQLLKNQVFTAIQPAATTLFTSLGDSMESLTPAIVMVVEAIVPLIEIFASLPAPVQAAIIGGLLLGSVLGKLVGPIMGVIKVLKLLSLAVAANPWVLLIAAVVALGIIIFKNWDKIKGYVEDALDAIVGFFGGFWDTAKGIWDDIVGWFEGVWESISGIVQGALDLIETITRPWVVVYTAIFSFAFNALSTFLETWAGRLQALFSNLFQWMTTAFEAVSGVLKAIWEPLWEAISAVVDFAVSAITKYIELGIAFWTTLFTGAWAVFQAIFQGGMDLVTGIVSGGINIITGLFDLLLAPIGGISGALETMQGVFQTVWDTVKNIMQGAYDFVVDIAGKIGDAVSDALGPVGDIAGFAGGVLSAGAGLLGFDEGGVVPGPKGSSQIIMAHGGETILPTHKKPLPTLEDMSATGGGSGGSVVIQGPLLSIDGPVNIRNDQDIVELSRSLADDANRELRATGKVGNAT